VTNPIWRVPVTNGLSTFSVSGGRAFTQIRRNIGGTDQDVCIAMSITNGVELWATALEISSYPSGGVGYDDGPRSTPTVDGGSVYVLSSYLKLFRLNATNGAVIWQTNLVTGFSASVIPWQNAASPVVEDGLIFLNANAGTTRLMALRTNDGSLVWRSQNEAMTHSTPVLTTMFGVRQLIFATQSGLASVNPLSGSLLWRTNYPFTYDISIGASPVVCSNIVFITMNYARGSAAFQIEQTNSTFLPRLLWSDSSLESHWMSAICYQGFLYGVFTPDDPGAELRCIDPQTGAQQWASGGFGHGGVVLVDNHLVVLTETGELVLIEPNPGAYTELGRFLAIPDYDPDANKCWNTPAVADGRIYVRSTAYGAAFDFSMPDLKLDPPQPVPANKLQLTVRAADGTPLNSNRLTSMTVRATTNLTLAREAWTALPNTLTLSNGVARATNVDASPSPRYFIVSEPK